ncbi:MAG: hypothetical protein HC817_13385 [Saprospiraceae bacterium]|nr:hypothetical protein [Saprospiraceae bacterium]
MSERISGSGGRNVFAELGAEVIKIENKTTKGDVTRSWRLPNEPTPEEASAYFYSVNYGKKHLFFDFQDKKIMKRHAKY